MAVGSACLPLLLLLPLLPLPLLLLLHRPVVLGRGNPPQYPHSPRWLWGATR